MSELSTLVSRLAAETLALRGLLLDAATSEATHKAERAKAMLRHKADGHTVAMAEAAAEADVADLYMARLTSAAVAESQKELIRSLRASIDAAQTERADLRAADVAMARGLGGAA